MFKRTHVCAFLIAGLPVLMLATTGAQRAEAPRSDRVTLETYLEMETAADPQLSPDGTQIIYTRGWIDKMNDRRECRGSGCRQETAADR